MQKHLPVKRGGEHEEQVLYELNGQIGNGEVIKKFHPLNKSNARLMI